jgi:hypothetical protein
VVYAWDVDMVRIAVTGVVRYFEVLGERSRRAPTRIPPIALKIIRTKVTAMLLFIERYAPEPPAGVNGYALSLYKLLRMITRSCHTTTESYYPTYRNPTGLRPPHLKWRMLTEYRYACCNRDWALMYILDC